MYAYDCSYESTVSQKVDVREIEIQLKNGRKLEMPVADRRIFASAAILPKEDEPCYLAEFIESKGISPRDVEKVVVIDYGNNKREDTIYLISDSKG